MLRKLGLGVLLVALAGTPCYGQEWAKKMFKVTEHDFGTVACAAKAEYEFEFENIYLEDIHVAYAYASCGCTSVRVENPLVKTYDKGKIVAHFNTDTFRGQRGATITVVIDQPFEAQVQLHVKGYIRGDVVVNPGSVQLGAIDQGSEVDKTVAVNYAGSNNWAIVNVKSSNPNITAKVVETGRNYGQVSYNLQVHLDKSAAAGYLNDQLILVTNDAKASQFPVLVEGQVQAGITVSPASLLMGVVQPGQKVTKQLIVKSKKPFRVLGISCDDPSFQFDTSKEDAAKELHLIPVTFSAGMDAGKVVKTIKIKTDQGEMTPELAAIAVVAASK